MTEEDEKRPFCLINSLRPGITVYSGFYCGFLCFPLTPSLLPRGSSECLLAGVESHMRNSHRLREDKQGDGRPIPGAFHQASHSALPLASATLCPGSCQKLLSRHVLCLCLTPGPLDCLLVLLLNSTRPPGRP